MKPVIQIFHDEKLGEVSAVYSDGFLQSRDWNQRQIANFMRTIGVAILDKSPLPSKTRVGHP